VIVRDSTGATLVTRAFRNGILMADPINDGPPAVWSFWAGDPVETAALADLDRIGTWRNAGTAGGTLTNSGGTLRPTWIAASANMNGKPSARFLGSSNHHLISPSITIPQNYWLVLIATATNGANSTTEMPLATGQSGNAGIGKSGSLNQWYTSAGTVVQSGVTVNTSPHLLVTRHSGATTTQTIDGIARTGGSAGTVGASAFKLGSAGAGTAIGSNSFTGEIHFAMLCTADPTTHASWPIILAVARDCSISV